MMYPYLTLGDDTEITHSEMKEDGRVKVYIETPDLKDGFHNATKIWITSSGKALFCNNSSKIPQSDLRKLMRVVDANSATIINNK